MILSNTNYLYAQHQKSVFLPKAYENYLNFQLDSCRYYIYQSPSSDPFSFYFKVLLTSTELFIDNDPDHFKEQKFIEKDLLDNLDDHQFTQDYATFLESEIKLHWAILKLKNGEELAAFWSLKQAYSLAKENVEKYPELLPSRKTFGILQIIFGLFPDKYHWILTLFGIEGNVNSGLEELNKINKSKHFLSLESCLITGLLHAYLLNDPNQAVVMLNALYSKHEHLLISYAYALSLMKNRQSERALDVIGKTKLKHTQPFILPHFYYLKGEIFLQQGSLEKAIENYVIFLQRQNGMNLIKDAYYKIGICYFIMDKEEESLSYFEKSRCSGWAKNEADKYAKFSLESESLSAKQLYQLRFATDGGFYETAFEIQQNIDTVNLNVHDQCEYYYRSARMYHTTGDIDTAIENYKKSIRSQRDHNWYFAPNAALQLGLIFILKNNMELAKKFLLVINNYEGYPYENSIRQKAKLAMNQLN